VEILVTSSINPYLTTLYPHMGPPTKPGSQAPQHLNPALTYTRKLTGVTHIKIKTTRIANEISKYKEYHTN